MNRRSAARGRARRGKRFYIASLGCPKNTVDSQAMAVLLQREGYQPADDAAEADLLIVNTCGFIAAARQESLETLRELAADLRPSQRLVAAGCWAQRDPAAILEAVPRVDALLGTRSWPQITTIARRVSGRQPSALQRIEPHTMALPEQAGAPGYAVTGRSAFLKVADGCSRGCAFCAIPSIKGPYVSRDLEAVLRDARALQDLGVLEINLIAQDITYYGYDRGDREGLVSLLENLSRVAPAIPWIRLLYMFPGYVTPRLIEIIRDVPQVLPYIDLPLQHAHPAVLRRMGRPADMGRVRETLHRIREALPEAVLRTTFIVGFPGETDEEFAALMEFVEEVRFDRVGVFTYSHEMGTRAFGMDDDVSTEVKEARYDQLMTLQQGISLALNQQWVGKRLDVLLEGVGDGITVGRSYRDAPEIDGLVIIPEERPVGGIVSVEITEALPYDLVGSVVDE
ncbi:MAG TPA: 30S ribosomal protein S12 methylthiotransferase RimO [Chloroflexi bacterium]|nr:30S ribosomal protein S12 methylthiotransferase RimO [Chloroflexota bacterium]